jgi:hypothetical protein
MRLRFKSFLCLSIMVLVSASCNRSIDPLLPNDGNLQHQDSGIVGRWSWILTTGGENGMTTPSTQGYTKTIQFGDNSIYSQYKNDTLQYQYPYTIKIDKLFFMKDSATIVSFGGRLPSYRVDVHSTDTLELGNLSVGGGYSRYVRLK